MTTAIAEPGAPPTQSTLPVPSLGYRIWFLLILTLVSASVTFERYMMVVLVEPVRQDLGLSDTEIGVVKDLGIAIVYVLAVMPLARIADRWSRRKMVALACAFWSAAIIVCGLAKNFGMLLVGRLGIGLGEGGFTPASQAWLADIFPARQRGTILSIFFLGASFGMFAGPAAGSALAAEFGWREALLWASVPGFILAPLVFFTLRDPSADRVLVGAGSAAQASFMDSARRIFAVRTIPPLVSAAALNALLTTGLVSWAPAFMARSHGVPAEVTGPQLGVALLLGSVVGHSIGGPLADWLGKRDMRWYPWMLMIAGLLATVIAFYALTGPADLVFVLLGVNTLVGGLCAAPLMALTVGLAPPGGRATTVALLMIAINVVGLGGGPLVVGWISDMIRPEYGEESLRIAMQSVLIVGLPSAVLCWIASRTVREDFAHATAAAGEDAGPMLAH